MTVLNKIILFSLTFNYFAHADVLNCGDGAILYRGDETSSKAYVRSFAERNGYSISTSEKLQGYYILQAPKEKTSIFIRFLSLAHDECGKAAALIFIPIAGEKMTVLEAEQIREYKAQIQELRRLEHQTHVAENL